MSDLDQGLWNALFSKVDDYSSREWHPRVCIEKPWEGWFEGQRHVEFSVSLPSYDRCSSINSSIGRPFISFLEHHRIVLRNLRTSGNHSEVLCTWRCEGKAKEGVESFRLGEIRICQRNCPTGPLKT